MKLLRKIARNLKVRKRIDELINNPFRDIGRLLKQSYGPILYVGANEGQCLKQMRNNLQNADIYCFEPFPDSCEVIKQKAKSYSNIHIEQTGVSDTSGRLFLVEGINSTTNRLVAEDTGGLLPIPVTSLDDFCRKRSLNKISLLKIDVEGMELSVLAGAMDILSQTRVDALLLECGMNPDNDWHTSLDNVCQMLEPLGYRILRFYEQASEWPTSQPHMRRADVAFISSTLYRRTV